MASENKPVSQLYLTTLSQLHYYDLSVGLRLIWLNNSQAFMFGVYSALTTIKSPTPFLHDKAQMLNTVIPIIGAIISLFTLTDIISGFIRIRALNNNYTENNHSDREGNFPRLDSTVTNRFFQRVSPVVIALIFLGIWVFLIMYDHQWL